MGSVSFGEVREYEDMRDQLKPMFVDALGDGSLGVY